MPFLQEFVDSALANGARPYLDENERLGVDSGMSSFVSSSRSHHEPSHGLRFEAYRNADGSHSLRYLQLAPSSLLPDYRGVSD